MEQDSLARRNSRLTYARMMGREEYTTSLLNYEKNYEIFQNYGTVQILMALAVHLTCK